MNNFYVYIYLDPRKPGKYVYGDYCFLYEPFYIGKGKGRRYKRCINRNKYFINKCDRIWKSNLIPIVIKLFKNINEIKSFEIEKQLILEIGRKDLNKGPLINFTDGGDGNSGWRHSEETKTRISKLNSGKNNGMFGKHHSEKSKIKMRLNPNRKLYGNDNPFFGKHHSNKSKELIRQNKPSIKGELNPRSKLTKDNIIDIKYSLLSVKKLSEKYNISSSQIYSIRNGRSWNHIL